MTWGASEPAETADAQRLMIGLLKTYGLAGVGSWYPTPATPEVPALPFLAVLDLGAPSRAYYGELASLQITAWDVNPTPAKALRENVASHLAVYGGSPAMAWVRPGPRQGVVQDDITGYWLAALTVTAFMKATRR